MESVAPAAAASRIVKIRENAQVARNTYRLRLDDPFMARAILPGQFLMIRPGPLLATDPLLGRPLALYDVVRDSAGEPVAIDIVYLVVGRGTRALADRKPGESVAVWGPLGNGFGPAPEGSVLLVAGGIGQTPFLALAREWLGSACHGLDNPASGVPRTRSSSITLFYGVRSADLLAGVGDFQAAGVNVLIATDDGSAGHHGYVTDLVLRHLEAGARPARIVGCGPVPMLRKLAAIADHAAIPCEVSLENHMACGFGACFSCVVPLFQGDGPSDYRRVCVDGPIVDAHTVDWSRM